MANVIPEWSKAYLKRPRNNLKSHIFIDEKIKFKPSFEKDDCPPSMSWLLGWEYSRQWTKERDEFYKAREDRNKPKHIKNDYKKWLEKRKPKDNFYCRAQGVDKLTQNNTQIRK
ncbi:uncharacterized protein LOC133325950 [Musca vetustissima]|uniref:uncharacterized protein LOC133325950 n=1 Tax=Musca vetustissima TaxID=27455 RepID=UPI002AB65B67|nr:uncharacterized protein LOC133325950 [Musca vetustissima]